MSEAKRGRVLITGAAGFTGHHMVAQAVKAGFSVRATDLSSRHYGAMFDALGVEFVASDLTRADGLEALLEGVTAVFHVAGIHDYSTPDPVMFAINVDGVRNLCEACTNASVSRFVHLSSAGVYGFGWKSAQPVAEDAEKLTPPLNNYNVSKWEGEKIVHRYREQHGLRATVLRPAAVYGARSEYGLYNAFKQVHSDRRKKKILMVGAGDRIEGFVHVEDLCRAVIWAYDNDASIGEVYNVADDSRLTTVEFFRMISRELLGEEKEFAHVPVKVLLPVASLSQLAAKIFGGKPRLERQTLEYLCCDRIWDNTKIKTDGFEFRYPTVETGIKETLRWYKDNGWLRC